VRLWNQSLALFCIAEKKRSKGNGQGIHKVRITQPKYQIKFNTSKVYVKDKPTK